MTAAVAAEVGALLAAGAAHHTAGRLAEAEGLYRQALTRDPLNPDGLHLLGLIASAVGKLEVAEGLIRLAVLLRPNFPDAWYNLGNIRRRRSLPEESRLDAALSALRHAAALSAHPRNLQAAGLLHAERAAERAGGLRALNADFNTLHRRNRAEPEWRGDSLLARLGEQGRASVLSDAEEALRLAPEHETVRHIVFLIRIATGELERGLDVLGPYEGDGSAEFSRLGAEVAWYLRRAGEARARYQSFIRRKCLGEVPGRPLLPEVAQAPAFAGRPRGPFPGRRPPVVIYTHYGNPDFLHYSIGQTLVGNPDARVILIGDRENRIDGVEHRLMEEFGAAARPVVERYRHDSGNAYCYELFCIARWFLFLDLCRREGIEEMFLLDSDYMLFADLAEVADRCRPLGLGLSFNSAHFSYFRIETLEAFCDHIVRVFDRLGEQGDDPAAFYSRNHSELFSDMAFIYDFQRTRPWLNFCLPEEGRRFDYSITDPEGFHATGGIKDIRFQDGLPHALPADGSPPIRFLGLHFQGLTKPMMRQAFHRRSWGGAAVPNAVAGTP